MSVASPPKMARQRRDDTSVKIASSVYRRAKLVASFRGITLAEYLSELLGKLVERDYQRMLDEAQKQSGSEKRE